MYTEYAAAWQGERICQLNPKPCPLIGMSPRPGKPTVPELGVDLDIRTDVPAYRVWIDGELVDEPTDLGAWWRDDLVAFVLGCSFSFEEALVDDGIEIRHICCGVNVPMYRTSGRCRSRAGSRRSTGRPCTSASPRPSASLAVL